MRIGRPQRVWEVRPVSAPVPEVLPEPEPAAAPEPEPARLPEPKRTPDRVPPSER